jgi:hypothetical protein
MSRRFQFSLRRLLASLSAACLAAALFAVARLSEVGLLVFCALCLDALIVGAAIGLLVGERPTRGAFRGVCWALCFLVVVTPAAFFVAGYYAWQSFVRGYMETEDRADQEEAALYRVLPATKAPKASTQNDESSFDE